MSVTSAASRFQRFWAYVALIAFVGTLGLPEVSASHRVWGDDPACEPAGVAPLGTALQIEAVPPSSPTDHCAVCHWLRTASGARAGLVASAVVSLQSAQQLVLPRVSLIVSNVVTHRPSRAPPVRLA